MSIDVAKTHKEFKYSLKVPSGYEKFSYLDVQPLYVKRGSGSSRIAFILDWVPTEDIKSKKLLSGVTGEFLNAILLQAETTYSTPTDYTYGFIAFNAYKTAGTSAVFQQQAKEEFSQRIIAWIELFKPDAVVLLGNDCINSLLQEWLLKSNNIKTPWYGVPLPVSIGRHKCLAVSTLSLSSTIEQRNELIGYQIRNIANALHKRLMFGVNGKQLENYTAIHIDSIGKFKNILEKLETYKGFVSVDTETLNLNKISNRLLTIQFSVSVERAYIIPIYHKDTPFDSDELKYIISRLKAFFEHNNTNKYHIFVNATFDLIILRQALKLLYYKAAIYDILAGEFCLDENLKSLGKTKKDWYYSLGNLSSQYGFEGYRNATFGKEDRKNIANHDLDDDLIKYCGYDVVVPISIHLKQIEHAKVLKHDKFMSMVTEQISDMLHMFSIMEHTGALIDVDWLFYLRSPQSPIENEIRRIENEFLNSKAVEETNEILLKRRGVPKTWYDAKPQNIFSLRKTEHKQILFFEVLKLEALDFTKLTKKGKLDKHFQKKYGHIPEVKLLVELGAAKKLRDSYVKSFILKLKSHQDFSLTKRIRAFYSYLKVVTGRLSASDPNLQQIPSHSLLGKNIKRLFIAEEGCLYIKVDYRVHEVRGLAIISLDRALAEVFAKARKIWAEYRLTPTPELKARLKPEADVHIMNAMYFFSLKLKQVTEDVRSAVKNVIFGLIYQRSAKSISIGIKQTLEYTEKLIFNYKKRFPTSMKFLDSLKDSVKKQLFVENPFGLRRHLWGLLVPKKYSQAGKIHASCIRKSVNSPIQGMSAQEMCIGVRCLDTMIYKEHKKKKRSIKANIENSVHDSLETTWGYKDFILGLDFVERALTEEVKKVIKERHGFTICSDLEIDFELGASLATLEKWDFSLDNLELILYKQLNFQKSKDGLNRDINVKKTMNLIFSRMQEDGPKWMKDQINKNEGFDRFLDYKFDETLLLTKLNTTEIKGK